ncbi:MAG: IPT/TIG domain-containing protein, partial [Myxococcota bacterium]|nr:IPT/TIG domain-containing protein [Myxococcota bacterium]
MKSSITLLLPLSLLACTENKSPYYDDINSVSVAAVDIVEETGNMGGNIVVVNGSGFGTDPKAITVMFGNQNAEVLEVSDNLVRVVSPAGPVRGGAVDIRVGTAQGQASLANAYSYRVPGNGIFVTGTVDGAPAVSPDGGATVGEGSYYLDEQIAYVSISNDSFSCYGGIHNEQVGGCDGFAYTGMMGIEGRAEGLEFIYPRGNTPHFGGKGGFASMTDVSWKEWSIKALPEEVVGFDDESALDSLRVDLGTVKMTNPALSGAGEYCADLPALANFTYNGDDELLSSDGEVESIYTNVSVSPQGVSPYGNAPDCYDGGRAYELDVLNFCMQKEYDEGQSFIYEPEWPIEPSFFRTDLTDEGASTDAIPIVLDVEKAQIQGMQITLPPYALFKDVTGRNDGTWAVQAMPDCPDSDDDLVTTTNDAVFSWEWDPIEWNCDSENGLCPGDGVKSVSSYIKVNVAFFSLGWFGGEGTPIRATITVPDNHNLDEESGKASLTLPSWVLYSFPTVRYDFGYESNALGPGQTWTGYGDPLATDYGYLIVTIDRVTEYVIPTQLETNIAGDAEEVPGTLVFAYSTGDMGFFNYENPLDSQDSCDDCLDNDGDGWPDDKDPDCEESDGVEEGGFNGAYTCNDNIDNDQDGFVDSEDADCETGFGAESPDCSDSVDNDGDGWIDGNDPGCSSGITENPECSDELDNDGDGLTDYDDPDCLDGITENPTDPNLATCNNGIDDDGDGWVDSDDLACTTAADEEDDGFSGTECNDGIDNDGHGDIDSDDYRCQRVGAESDEAPEFLANCINGADDDNDGYIDANDPDCEITSVNENTQSLNPELANNSWVTECYDGIDNDGCGDIDAQDPECVDSNGVPDGFAPSEGLCVPVDKDGDGYDNLVDCD